MPAFLTAEWRDLVMLNYPIEPAALQPLVPRGTELDSFQGRMYISLVGFRFVRTRLLGVPVPFHIDFEEVNLRFYVRRVEGAEIRRGVCFIQEVVPRWAISTVARLAYNENYRSLPMAHSIDRGPDRVDVEYSWRLGRDWNRIRASGAGEPLHPPEGSLEQFIAEHYWGYCAQRDGSSISYRVEHPPWRVWPRCNATFEGDAIALYGPEFGEVLSLPPLSAFLADGSDVAVLAATRLR